MVARQRKTPAWSAEKKAPELPKDAPVGKTPGTKKVSVISEQDAGMIAALLARVDLKGSEVPAFNRVQALLAHVCGVRELSDADLVPPRQPAPGR